MTGTREAKILPRLAGEAVEELLGITERQRRYLRRVPGLEAQAGGVYDGDQVWRLWCLHRLAPHRSPQWRARFAPRLLSFLDRFDVTADLVVAIALPPPRKDGPPDEKVPAILAGGRVPVEVDAADPWPDPIRCTVAELREEIRGLGAGG